MNTWHALLLIAVVTGALYAMWRVLDLVFELIEDYYWARTEGRAKPSRGAEESESR